MFTSDKNWKLTYAVMGTINLYTFQLH